MSSVVHTSSSPTFNAIRNSSKECIEKVKESFASSGPLLINLPTLATQHHHFHHLLFPILSKTKEFINLLKKIIPDALNTIPYPSFLTKYRHPEHAEIFLEVLKSLASSVRRFTDESLESIGKESSETLIEITRQMQELEKELDEAKVSVRIYNSNFSAFGMAFATLLAPFATLAVTPCLQRLDLVYKDLMENPIVDKLKVLRAILFSIHSTITVAGKIQDSVYRLSNNPVNDLFDPAETQRYEDELKFMGCAVKMTNEEDFKIKKKKGMEEGGPSNSGPFSDGRYAGFKELFEMERLVADTMAEVEMAEHELEQLIQTLPLMPPLQEV